MRLLLAARLSRKLRNGEQGMGIETQDQRGQDWAQREGHQIIGVAADTKSGTVAPWDRKNLRPWVTDPDKMAQYDGILAYKNDRLSRGMWSDEVRIRLWAEENGKVLVIVDGPQWPPRHDGDKWSWEAQATQARKEWEDGRERSMRAQTHRRDNGFLVGDAPFGYVIVCSEKCGKDGQDCPHGKLLQIDPVTSRYVRGMVEMYLAGESLPSICRWLDSEGAKPRHGGKWWPTGVRYILGNPALIGRRKDAEGNTILKFEPILDEVTWKRLQAKLAGNPRHSAISDEPTLLTGIIFCGLCGRIMHRKPVYTKRRDGSKTYHLYYRCDGTPRDPSKCRNMFPMAEADGNVGSWVTDVIGGAELIERVVMPGSGHDDDIQDVKRSISLLDPEAADYDSKLSGLRSELSRLKALPQEPARVTERLTGVKVRDYWAKADVAARRRFLLAGKVRVDAVSELKARKGTEARELQFSVTVEVGGDWSWR